MEPLDKYQTTWKRWLASMIDGLVFLPITLATDYYRHSSTNSFLILTILHVLLYTLYLVIGHGYFGQTVGKYLMGIKVLNIEETRTIGYLKAFLRESPWFLAQTAGIVFLIVNHQEVPGIHNNVIHAQPIVDLISSCWFLLEVITMLVNKKRRALHDLIAGSVVVNLGAVKRDSLRNQRDDLMRSLKAG